MKYSISETDVSRLSQLARSNFGELLLRVLEDRTAQLVKSLKLADADMFRQVQGRALELDDLLTALKIKERD
jgi:hypothetical protein